MSTTLQIRTSWHSPGPMEDLTYMDTLIMPQIVRPRRIFIEVRMELLDGYGRCGMAYVWKMEARDNYDEAMVNNYQFAQIIQKAEAFYREHIPSCPICAPKHFGAIEPAKDWIFSHVKPEKDGK